jgi:hypothetical protein
MSQEKEVKRVLNMPRKKATPKVQPPKKRKPRASTDVLIKREEARLARLKRHKKLIDMREQVKELRDEIEKRGYEQ